MFDSYLFQYIYVLSIIELNQEVSKLIRQIRVTGSKMLTTVQSTRIVLLRVSADGFC